MPHSECMRCDNCELAFCTRCEESFLCGGCGSHYCEECYDNIEPYYGESGTRFCHIACYEAFIEEAEET